MMSKINLLNDNVLCMLKLPSFFYIKYSLPGFVEIYVFFLDG